MSLKEISYESFDPREIDWQNDFVFDLFNTLPFDESKQEVLLSGSYGSAKSTIAAWICICFCIEFPKYRFLIGRKSLPDLKDTLFRLICDLLRNSPNLIEDNHFKVLENTARIKFKNGSEIFSKTWGDKKYKKFRSVDADAAIVEELTENDLEDREAYYELFDRIGRRGMPFPVLISCTNPDSPTHWAYKHFMLSDNPYRHVYYSITADNKFLPSWYAESIRAKYSAKEVRRFLYGEWVELASDSIYYGYDINENFKKEEYIPHKHLPVIMAWDFNIGVGKPLSVAFLQRVGDNSATATFHVYAEVVIEGLRTREILRECLDRGLLDHPNLIKIQGDATGRARSTSSEMHNYEIIDAFLSQALNSRKQPIWYEIDVNMSNPAVKKRHNLVNGLICNDRKERRLFVYEGAEKANEGFRLTRLKKGAGYVEDDSFDAQHITTAIGYAVCQEIETMDSGAFGMRML